MVMKLKALHSCAFWVDRDIVKAEGCHPINYLFINP
jgi:hypothetical protein